MVGKGVRWGARVVLKKTFFFFSLLLTECDVTSSLVYKCYFCSLQTQESNSKDVKSIFLGWQP